MSEEEIFEKYMENPHWKKEYEEAPSDLCKKYLREGYIASGLAWFKVGDAIQHKNAWKRAETYRKQFDKDDWEYIINHAGTGIAKAELTKQMKKALGD